MERVWRLLGGTMQTKSRMPFHLELGLPSVLFPHPRAPWQCSLDDPYAAFWALHGRLGHVSVLSRDIWTTPPTPYILKGARERAASM